MTKIKNMARELEIAQWEKAYNCEECEHCGECEFCDELDADHEDDIYSIDMAIGRR